MQTKLFNFFTNLVNWCRENINLVLNKLPWFIIGNYKISILLPVVILICIIFLGFLIVHITKKKKKSEPEIKKIEPSPLVEEAKETPINVEEEVKLQNETTKKEPEVKNVDDVTIEVLEEPETAEKKVKEEILEGEDPKQKFIEKVKQEFEARFINLIERYFPPEIDFKIKPRIDDDIITLCQNVLDKLSVLEKMNDNISFTSEYYRAKSIFYFAIGDYTSLKQNVDKALDKFPENETFYIQKAIILINENDYFRAEELLQKAKQISSSNMKIYLLLGEIFFIQEKYSDALEMYKKVILLDDKSSIAYAYKGYLLAKKGFISEGERNLKRALNINYRNYVAYYFLGDIYNELRFYRKAVAMFKRAKKFGCNFKDINEKLALSFIGLNKYLAAVKLLKKQYAKGELSQNGIEILADALRGVNNIEQAILIYKRLIALTSDNEYKKKIYNKIASIYYENKDYKNTVSTLKRLAEIEEDKEKERNIFLKIGNICLKKIKNYEEAEKYFKIVIEKEPENINALYGLASALFIKQDYENAIKYYEKTLKNGKTRVIPEIVYKLGFSYYKLKRYPEAVKYLTEAQNLGLIEEKLFIALGYSLIQVKRISDAMVAYQKALNINPFNYQTHNNIGVLYAQQKQYDKAIKEFKEALKIKPDNKDALFNLHRAYRILAETESEEYLAQLEKVV